MVHSSATRYKNLFRHIENWPVYFTRKLKKGFRPIIFITKGHPIKFIVPSKALYLVFKEIFVTDFYDIDALTDSLPARPVIIDIGANAGYFNVILFSKKPDAVVYAYEPIRSNYELFTKIIAINPALQNRVHLFNNAVTGTPQEFVELFMETASDNSVIASVYADFDTQNQHTIQVPAISLQQIVQENKLQHIDLVKVDCEGSEYPIIYETPDEVWKNIQMLTIEVHNLDQEKRNVDFLGRFLKEKGYMVVIEPAHTNCFTLLAQKK
ncbi:MAG: FkbM family methyltransferase [Chitinophagaceae bacterium]